MPKFDERGNDVSAETRNVSIGGCWEYSDWEIRRNQRMGRYAHTDPCPHAREIREIRHEIEGRTYIDHEWVCPRVVVAFNEGGHCSTGICLDCIVEAAATLEPR